jgi:hypothetical protein
VIEKIKFMTMVRSADWKLVHFLGSDEGQLFDLKNDPDEERNLWKDSSSSERKTALIAQISGGAWRVKSRRATGWPSADKCLNPHQTWSTCWRRRDSDHLCPLSGRGQIVLIDREGRIVLINSLVEKTAR